MSNKYYYDFTLIINHDKYSDIFLSNHTAIQSVLCQHESLQPLFSAHNIDVEKVRGFAGDPILSQKRKFKLPNKAIGVVFKSTHMTPAACVRNIDWLIKKIVFVLTDFKNRSIDHHIAISLLDIYQILSLFTDILGTELEKSLDRESDNSRYIVPNYKYNNNYLAELIITRYLKKNAPRVNHE